MLKIVSSVSLSLALCCGFGVAGCSSSASPTDSTSGGSGGTASTAGGVGGTSDVAGANSGGTTASAGSAGMSGTGGTAGTGSAGTGNTSVGSAPCAYSVSGGLNDPTTDAPYGCGNGHVEQPNGSGDFTASIGGGFMDAAGNIVTLACTISSATAPTAGATWMLLKDAHANGNCQLNAIKGTTATLWSASSTEGSISGSAAITFVSATLTPSTVHPSDVFYVYDVTLTATLPGLTAGAADVTISGTFKNTALPLGS